MTETLFTAQQQIRQLLRRSREALDGNESVDLTGLDAHVAEFCRLIASLPATEMQAWKTPLEDLRAEVTSIGDAVVAQREAVVKALEALNKHQQAHRAYQQSRKDGDA